MRGTVTTLPRCHHDTLRLGRPAGQDFVAGSGEAGVVLVASGTHVARGERLNVQP